MDKDDLKILFYRNKTNLSFEKDVTKTKQNFNVADNYNSPLYEENKVSKLFDKINFPNNYLTAEVNICKYGHSDIFETDSTYLSTVISHILP